MSGNATGSSGTSRKKTFKVGNRVYAITIRPKRRLDGSAAFARSWEVALRRPTTRYIGCGTAGSRADAEAAIDAAIARHTGRSALAGFRAGDAAAATLRLREDTATRRS